MKPRLILAAVALGLAGLLQGCAPALVGGAALGTATVVADPRTASEQLNDKEIALKADVELTNRFGNDNRITVSPYNGQVLLVGTALTEEIREEAAKIVSEIPGVSSVKNRVTVGKPLPFSQATSDTWLASKVRMTLIAARDVPSNSVKVTVENDDVYLQGMVLPEQAEDVAEVVRKIPGVKEVFTLFNILSRTQHDRVRGVEETRQNAGSSSDSSSRDEPVPLVDPGPESPSASPVSAPTSPEARPI